MTKTLTLVVAIVATLSSAAPAWAHDDYRILGTVLRVSAGRIEVKQTRDAKTVAIRMDQATIVTRDDKKTTSSELKAGVNVVVDATGDSVDDLVALEVKIVPVPA